MIFARVAPQFAGVETSKSWRSKNAEAFKTMIAAGSTVDDILAAHDRLRGPDGQPYLWLPRLQHAMALEQSARLAKPAIGGRMRKWYLPQTGEMFECLGDPSQHGKGYGWVDRFVEKSTLPKFDMDRFNRELDAKNAERKQREEAMQAAGLTKIYERSRAS